MNHNYKLELYAEGFSFPTSMAIDDEGVLYVAESGLPFGGNIPGGKVWEVSGNGHRKLIGENFNFPLNGLTYHKKRFIVSEGGHPARLTLLFKNGDRRSIIEGLPGPGNYHTNMTVIGPDGKIYFSQGAMTNTGVIGLDAYDIGWLKRLPHAHDIPGYDIVLRGQNFETKDPFSSNTNGRALTGAFCAFGKESTPNQELKGTVPCTSSIMRCDIDGNNLELVAWGVRNAYGLGFLPDGRLLAVDQGADDRGSRPAGNVPDLLFEIKQGAWYGWPDFIGDESIGHEKFKPENGHSPSFILSNHGNLPKPEKPLVKFPPHCAAVKFDVARNGMKWAGNIFVALFGDEVPMTAPKGPKVGRSIARIDPTTWEIDSFLNGSFARPIDIKFHPYENKLFILDFGEFEMTEKLEVDAKPNTGKVWCVNLID